MGSGRADAQVVEVLFSLLYLAVRRLMRLIVGGSPVAVLEIENVVLCHPLRILERTVKRPALARRDKVVLAAASLLLVRRLTTTEGR